MAELRNWCRGEAINPEYALLVKDIPEDAEITLIEETLQSIKALGRVRVRGRRYDPQTQHLMALCECCERVNVKAIPLDVLPQGSDQPWRILGVSDEVAGSQQSSESEENTKVPLQACSPEAIIRAVGDLMERQGRLSVDSNVYRRLRTFSGVVPTPLGEEQLENWLEQARLMVDNCERPDREKRLKIIESLKGPAAEIARAVRFSNPDASSEEYIEAIQHTFGSAETGEELYFAFRLLCQHPGERLSEFLRRIERTLSRVIQKGDLAAKDANAARLDQIIKGAVGADMMLLNLRLRERRDNPPDFLQLLSEIRTEEGYEASRQKLKSTVKPVRAKTVVAHADSGMQELQAEVKALKLQLAECSALLPAHPVVVQKSSMVTTDSTEHPEDNRDVKALKKEEIGEWQEFSSENIKALCKQIRCGSEKSAELIKDRFYWPKMSADIEEYVRNCGRCIARKTLPQRAASLNKITTFPAKDQKASTVARVLFEKYFVHYGLPACIHSDQERDFESKLIRDLGHPQVPHDTLPPSGRSPTREIQ
ncbi:paraneoplastic antigen Ma1 homolog [Scleropages formosus]|uniref:paraneoplastic antigen Ma1 homolog n=1 Tax=Scleropages formosus TaxID=113540 RepID=UPI0010FA9E57|nr:paraneoplastic antigen Ma1 homolog [Scleropages formosus]